MKRFNIKLISIKISILFLILSCNNGKNQSNQTILVKENSNENSIEKLIENDSLIQLTNRIERNFSNPKTKDKFTISIIGKNILEGEMIFKIIDSNGKVLFIEKYPSDSLINQYILDENSTNKEKEDYIKKRVSEFFKVENFSTPAIINQEYDSDYSDETIWNDIKSDSTAIGFYYLIGLENGCKIAYSKKENKVVKYFCCC